MITLVSTLLFLSLVSAFALRTCGIPRRLAVRDRWGLLGAAVTALTGFAIASLFVNWVNVPVAVWLVAVGMAAAGGMGAGLRWPQIPWSASTHPALRAAVVLPYWSACGLVIAVAFG